MDMDKELLTAKEVAEYLRIAEGTIYVWVHRKKIPALKVNGALRFRREDIESIMERRGGRWPVEG